MMTTPPKIPFKEEIKGKKVIGKQFQGIGKNHPIKSNK